MPYLVEDDSADGCLYAMLVAFGPEFDRIKAYGMPQMQVNYKAGLMIVKYVPSHL